MAVDRTADKARRGRALAERLLMRSPSLFAPAVRLVVGMPRGRLRSALLRYGVRRGYAAFNRRDWELNTMPMDREQYEFVNTDPSRDMIGMADVAGVAGYVAMMERWHEGWDTVGVSQVPGSEVHDAGPNALLTLDRWRGHLGETGMTLDLDMATLRVRARAAGAPHALLGRRARAS